MSEELKGVIIIISIFLFLVYMAIKFWKKIDNNYYNEDHPNQSYMFRDEHEGEAIWKLIKEDKRKRRTKGKDRKERGWFNLSRANPPTFMLSLA